MANKQNGMQHGNEMEELHTIMLDENDRNIFVGTSSIIGRRKEQQDSIKTDTYYSFIENERAISVLCDGMGGLSGGAKASQLCSSIVFDSFHQIDQPSPVPEFYKSIIFIADTEVNALKNEEGGPLNAGTTLVSVVILGNHLYWASVGDSRIYIIRGEEILCITKDHNLLTLLNEKVARGEITQDEADNTPKKEALVSFIGMGGVRYIDMNVRPFKLLDGDYIILCSDGLYRSVTEEEIKRIVRSFDKDTQQSAQTLTNLALSKMQKHQDNTSVIVIKYQDSGKFQYLRT